MCIYLYIYAHNYYISPWHSREYILHMSILYIYTHIYIYISLAFQGIHTTYKCVTYTETQIYIYIYIYYIMYLPGIRRAIFLRKSTPCFRPPHLSLEHWFGFRFAIFSGGTVRFFPTLLDAMCFANDASNLPRKISHINTCLEGIAHLFKN